MTRAGCDGDDGSSPILAGEFARLMAQFAPFEAAPRVAVAVSGGADSMALALLAGEWARALGGGVTALTVDHRLRPSSADEAARVAVWLGRRGVPHRTLVREGPPLRGNVQAQARAARYRLLEAWCAGEGVLHLLTAHHREDQGETLLLRLARGSGLDGLAGMAAVSERRACRVLRPFLGVGRARLAATLMARGQDWIEDPSNADPAYARARLRRAAPLLAAEGLTPLRLAATARQLARARMALESDVAAVLARSLALHPAGFAWLDAGLFGRAPDEVGLRALAAVVTALGGRELPPRFERIERLWRDLPGLAQGRTLAGCRILPRRGRILICREPASLAPPLPARAGVETGWDGRFALRLPATAPEGLTLGALGAEDAAAIEGRGLPPASRPSLPALRDAAGLVAVPHLQWRRAGLGAGLAEPLALRFSPARPLTRGSFRVV